MPETARLLLRPPAPSDVDALTVINADPEVARFVSRTGPMTREQTEALFARYVAHWDEFGFGWWMAELRDTGEVIGFVGLSHPTFLPEVAHEVEVGWRLARSAWGRGLATEGGREALRFAFGEMGLQRVVSIIDPANERSISVARKLGMHRERELDHPMWPVAVSLYVRTSEGSAAP